MLGETCGFLSKPICPFTEVHPLLGVKGDGKSKKKQAGRPKGSKGKEKDSPFKPKLYKGDRGLPLEGSAKGKVQAELSQPLTGKDEGVLKQPLALFLKCFFLLLPCESFQLRVDYVRKLEAALGGRSGERCARDVRSPCVW